MPVHESAKYCQGYVGKLLLITKSLFTRSLKLSLLWKEPEKELCHVVAGTIFPLLCAGM